MINSRPVEDPHTVIVEVELLPDLATHLRPVAVPRAGLGSALGLRSMPSRLSIPPSTLRYQQAHL
jgi:hypothetical protein